MRVVVFGGTGFIGSNLCETLVKRGDEVVCIDNNSTGSFDNVKHLSSSPNFTFIEHDIVKSISYVGHIDRIYHLACPASPPAYQADPIKTIQTCTVGTMNVLNFAKEKGARVLLTSTSEVYGDPEISPQPESYRGSVNTLGPRACYDEGKRISETLFMEYHRCRNVDVRIARIFNTYGPRMSPTDGRVITNYLTQILAKKDITVYGSGKQTRSFCYVDDTVAGLIALMEQTGSLGPVNIGNPHEMTMMELVDVCRMVVSHVRCNGCSDYGTFGHTDVKVIHMPLPQDDPTQRRPDISLAKRLMNWQPTTSIIDGLISTVDYIIKHQDNEHNLCVGYTSATSENADDC